MTNANPLANLSPSVPQRPASLEERFVFGVINKCQHDNGLAARLRRADNPATEYQSWEFLAQYDINLEFEERRLPFALLAATMSRAKADRNGTIPLGRAIAMIYEDGRDNAQAKARLRRLLACNDIPELCRILRPILTLIDSRISQPIDYVRLLSQLRSFYFDPQRIRAKWAQDFYGTAPGRNAKSDADATEADVEAVTHEEGAP